MLEDVRMGGGGKKTDGSFSELVFYSSPRAFVIPMQFFPPRDFLVFSTSSPNNKQQQAITSKRTTNNDTIIQALVSILELLLGDNGGGEETGTKWKGRKWNAIQYKQSQV